jgi:hypothetical protein
MDSSLPSPTCIEEVLLYHRTTHFSNKGRLGLQKILNLEMSGNSSGD